MKTVKSKNVKNAYKLTNLTRDNDKFLDKEGNIIYRIIDNRIYKYENGNYMLLKMYKKIDD